MFTISLKSQAHEDDEEEGEGNTVITISFSTVCSGQTVQT